MTSLRNELREFVLKDVEVLGEERALGTGSYGYVQKVRINGVVYAAKKIHEVLMETNECSELEKLAEKYLSECQLMSRMRHPNVIQFIGVCFLAESRLPLLVMERLECSVDELLETTPTLPLSVSVYILIGVCQGLLYLHRESVLHRDLTARNVLLTTFLVAKITDFGNSRIVCMEQGRLARTLTKFPGTLVYMPPEALSEGGQYGPSLDVFSFGVLMLYVLTQVFPVDLLPPTYTDPNDPDLLLARSEFERRSVYTAHLEKRLPGGQEHHLFSLVRGCLANSPEKRPAPAKLLSSLKEAETETEVGLLHLDIVKVETARALRAKEQRIETLQREVAVKDVQLQKVVDQLAEMTEKNSQLTRQLEGLQADLTAKDAIIAQKDDIIAQKGAIAEMEATTQAERHTESRLSSRKVSVQGEQPLFEQSAKKLHSRDLVIQERGSSALVRRGGIAKSEDSIQELRPPLTLKWRRGKYMPFNMTALQSTVVGYMVYVGGGFARDDSDKCTVMKLNLQRDKWTRLPQYSVKFFAMTSFANQLVLVGGADMVTWKRINKIAVLESGKWTHPYPPMNIARHSSTAVYFKSHLLVAGGIDNQDRRTSSVEVLDMVTRRWCTTESLPNPRSLIKSTLIGDTLYITGGFDYTGQPVKALHRVDLNELITKDAPKQATHTLWATIKDTPLKFPAPLSVGGSLLTVGGLGDRGNSNTSIYLYQPDTKEWVKVGDLPTARHHCTCSVLPSGEAIIAGGETTTSDIRTVDFLSISGAQ